MTIHTLDRFEQIIEKEYQASVRSYLNEQASFVRTGVEDALLEAPEEYDRMLEGRLGDCDGLWTPTVPICVRRGKQLFCDDQHNSFQTDAYKGKAHIVVMSPQKFLNSATDIRHFNAEVVNDLEEKITSCKAIDTPYLNVDLEKCQVKGHEGRHRAAAAKRAGVEKIPVIIYHDEITQRKEKACLDSQTFKRQEEW